MLDKLQKTSELLKQLVASKKNLSDTLVAKGEEASFNEPFDDLVQKAADYIPKTYVLVDEAGNEVVATMFDETKIFDATENDVREGKVFATEAGVKTGTKVIPSYHTSEGYRFIPAGTDIIISLPILDCYDFTKLQAMICPYTSSISASVCVEKVVIESGVYPVQSVTAVATVTKDAKNKSINIGIKNDSDVLYLIRYFTYKEIY